MREDLLGYLLDALDDRERQRVVEALRRDPKLRAELEALRRSLHPLDDSDNDMKPPDGLADQACDLVEACDEAPDIVLARVNSQPARRCGKLSCDPRELGIGPRSWSTADVIVAAGIFLAVSLLFFPALAGSRFRSRITACQNNLRCLGNALANYSEANGGYFPSIPVDGNLSAAGVYGPKLLDEQFLTDARFLICPGSSLAERADEFRPPTLAELDRASVVDLWILQNRMGGSYGYTLGYVKNGRYYTPRNRGRACFALMSDTPSLHLAASQSNNHGGRGQNVLFEDQRVEFLASCVDNEGIDHLFRNRRGFVEAGQGEDDSVIGVSFAPPLLDR